MACQCGCGGQPKSPQSRFLPGHDARRHGAAAPQPNSLNYVRQPEPHEMNPLTEQELVEWGEAWDAKEAARIAHESQPTDDTRAEYNAVLGQWLAVVSRVCYPRSASLS